MWYKILPFIFILGLVFGLCAIVGIIAFVWETRKELKLNKDLYDMIYGEDKNEKMD